MCEEDGENQAEREIMKETDVEKEKERGDKEK